MKQNIPLTPIYIKEIADNKPMTIVSQADFSNLYLTTIVGENIEYEIIPFVIKHNNTIINKCINSNNKKTIQEIFYELFPDETGFEKSLFYILNGKLVSSNSILTDIANPDCINKLETHLRIRGGMEFEDIPVIGQVFRILRPIINPLGGIEKFFVLLLQFIIWFFKFAYWLVIFIIWVFSDLLNPVNLLTDFWNSIKLIIVTLIGTIFNVITGLLAFGVNQIGEWMQGFWGWDQSNITLQDKNSNYFQGIDRNKGRKCYLTNNNRVPFSILLGTILCPPLGVFMDMGITGWMNILICFIFTLMFYLPGLFYALLVIYS